MDEFTRGQDEPQTMGDVMKQKQAELAAVQDVAPRRETVAEIVEEIYRVFGDRNYSRSNVLRVAVLVCDRKIKRDDLRAMLHRVDDQLNAGGIAYPGGYFTTCLKNLCPPDEPLHPRPRRRK